MYLRIVVCILIPTVIAKDAICSLSLTVPTGKCCSYVYAPYCCPGIPVCADEVNITVVQKYALEGCSLHWNFTACRAGFYSTDGKTTLPCPPGYFCEAKKLCLKPCPIGGYCIENKLEETNCSKFQKCCPPSNSAPIFDKLANKFICPGNHYPSPCQGGYYCPNATTIYPCPAGHFCRKGSDKPITCPMLSWCNERETSANTLLPGLIFNACFLFVFMLTVLFFNYRHDIRFYFKLYKKRITGTDGLKESYSLAGGIRLAIAGVPKLDDESLEIEPKTETYNITFENLSLKLTSGASKGKAILQGVTGELKSGEVTAVLGPSGSGKTTFLNVLCGKAFYGECEGNVKINGKYANSFEKYRNVTGFVPQEDIMHRSLTVAEVLYYNALLRLPVQSERKNYGKMVKKVLKLLSISHIAHSQIGDEKTRGISGGQRRRVNIGMELVADPTNLFLDEPTTGLDSSSSLTVVTALKTIASMGKLTITCVIHQPRYEILRMFDKVLFLGRGGRTVYSGTVENAENYFASVGYPLPPFVNPADFYMDVISGNIKSQSEVFIDIYQEWRNYHLSLEPPADTSQEIAAPESTEVDNAVASIPQRPKSVRHGKFSRKRAGPGFCIQLLVFMRREFVLQLHMAKTIFLDQSLTLLAGAVLGLLFREVDVKDIHETTVLANIVAGLGAVVAATRRFGEERVVYWRESASGINRFSYFFAVNLVYIPTLVISPLVFLSVYYNLAAFLAPFPLHYLVYICAWFCLSGLGYIFALMMTPRNSYIAAITTVVIMAMLSGGAPELCELDDIYIAPAIYSLSFSRWVTEAIFEIEAKERTEALSDVISDFQIDNHYDLQTYNIAIAALISMGVGFRIIALLLLLFTNRGQQK